MIVAFWFGALLEALAGFGTPVAVTAVMLIALGFRPIKAAAVALVANTAPVAFGAIAIPITTLSEVTGLDKGELGAMVGRPTPFLALIVPLILIGMVDGRRGIRQTWPVAVIGGLHRRLPAGVVARGAAARRRGRPLHASGRRRQLASRPRDGRLPIATTRRRTRRSRYYAPARST